MAIDHSLYPDLDEGDLPDTLSALEDQADYIHRLCGAWDFYGFSPSVEGLQMLAGWPEALRQFPILQSPAYCALCDYFGIPHGPPEPFLGRLRWEEQDELEGRSADPCLAEI